MPYSIEDLLLAETGMIVASGADPLILSLILTSQSVQCKESVIQLAPQATALKSIVYDVLCFHICKRILVKQNTAVITEIS